MNAAPLGRRVHEGLDRLLVPVENVAAAIAGFLTVLAMVLTTADALMRYFFSAPLVFQFYLTSNYLLVGMIMMALPWGFRTGGYIRVGVITERIPAALRFPLFRVGLAISAGYLALLTWKSWQYFATAWEKKLVYIEDLNWPVAWSWIWVPVGCGLLALRVLLVAFGPAGRLHIEHNPEEEI